MPTPGAPKTDPSLFRYMGPGDFGLRLPPHPVATEGLMTTDKETAEIIRLLRTAEVRSRETVTHGDLTIVSNTVMAGLREVGVRLDAHEGQLRAHAVWIKAIDDRTGGTLSMRPPLPRRMVTPMPENIDVEKTAGGGIRITDGAQWEKVLRRLDDQEKAIDTLEESEQAAKTAERTAQERQGGALEYATKQRKLVKKLIAALVAGGPVLVTVSHYILKWLQQ